MLSDMDAKKVILQIQYKEVGKIIQELQDDIPYAIVKGVPLSIAAYNNWLYRKAGDIDLLVSRKNVGKLTRTLIKNGYYTEYRNREDKLIALMYSHQTRPFVKHTCFFETTFDVNYDIFWGEYEGKRVNIDDFLKEPLEIEVAGCRIKTLTHLKAMIQLILHHYKEMNSLYHLSTHNCITINMFADVYHLWKNHIEDISIRELRTLSEEYEIVEYVFYILFYTNVLFQDRMLKDCVNYFRTPKGEYLLSCYGLCEKERKEWKCDFRTRFQEENLFDLIKNQLTSDDIEKINSSRIVFGEG